MTAAVYQIMKDTRTSLFTSAVIIRPSVLVCFSRGGERPAHDDPPGSTADRDRTMASGR